jgi:ParB family transcriptional regulator, chromosome partitioning protein
MPVNTIPEAAPIRPIPLIEISESPTNPRKAYDEIKLRELADSIHETFLIAPIIVRPWPAGRRAGKGIRWECVAGSRRLRAHQLLERSDILAREVALNDGQVIELQLIENAQRADIHPLEESESYAKLLTMDGYTIPVLAAKVGHPEKYIHQRLKFQNLTPSLQKMFSEGVINIGHAELLSPLPAEQQTDIEDSRLWRTYWPHGAREQVRAILPVADLKQLIGSEYLLHLSGAPWKLSDAELDPVAGACTACPKRTGSAPALFDDVELKKSDRCLDKVCFAGKRKAYLASRLALAEKTGTPLVQISQTYSPSSEVKKAGILGTSEYGFLQRAGKCANLESAIVADGSEIGRRVMICRTMGKRCQECPWHGGPDLTDKPLSLWEQRAKNLPKQIDQTGRKRVLAAILEKHLISVADGECVFPHAKLQILAAPLAAGGNQDLLDVLNLDYANRSEIRTASATRESFAKWIGAVENSPAGDDLARISLGLALADTIEEYCEADHKQRLRAAAAAYNVDYDKILKTVSTEMTSHFKARRARAEGKKGASKNGVKKPTIEKKAKTSAGGSAKHRR